MAIRFTFTGLFERFKSRKQGAGLAQLEHPSRGKGLTSPRRALGEKYSEEAYRQVKRIHGGSGGAERHVDREMRKLRLKYVYDLAAHPKLDKENLPVALKAANATTIGTVKTVLDHRKMVPEAVPAAMYIINTSEEVRGEDSGQRRVFAILEHPKTTPKSAHTFLEAAAEYGYPRTMNFMSREDVDASNITAKLERYKRMGNTQRIKLE